MTKSLRGTLPAGLHLAVVGSAVAHTLVILVLVIGSSWRDSRPVKRQTVLTTKLVRLGKERPKEWLPRKVAPEPATPAKPTAVPPPASAEKVPSTAKKPPSPKQEPKSVPTREPQLSAQERIAQLGKVQGALDRLRQKAGKDEPAEGHPDGSPDGEVTDLTRAIIGNKFGTEVHRCMKAVYAVEGIDADRLAGRSATVVVRVAPDGKFLDWKIEQSSGLRVMDRAVERAIRRCGKVSPPDEAIRDQVRDDGIEIVFEP